jgi:polyhydroxybutyrate depolymerase
VQIPCESFALLVAALLAAQLAACGQGDINLGLRGGVRMPLDAEMAPPDSETVDAGPGPSADGSASGGTLDAAVGAALDADTPSADAEVEKADVGMAVQKSVGCGKEPPAADTSIRFDGMTGHFLVDRPVGYDKTKPYPLLLTFRGANVTAEMFRGYLRLPQAAASEAIAVHLDCLNDAAAWDVARDLPFVDALLDHLGSSYCINEQRRFAVGHTSGAAFVNTLGCLRGDKLRAIAPFSVGPTAANGPGAPSTCTGTPAVWLIQGVQDPTLGPARFNRDQWRLRNQCEFRSTAVDPFPCVEYAGCAVGAPLRYCEYSGGIDLPDFASGGMWSFFRSL